MSDQRTDKSLLLLFLKDGLFGVIFLMWAWDWRWKRVSRQMRERLQTWLYCQIHTILPQKAQVLVSQGAPLHHIDVPHVVHLCSHFEIDDWWIMMSWFSLPEQRKGIGAAVYLWCVPDSSDAYLVGAVAAMFPRRGSSQWNKKIIYIYYMNR